jgi:hypothetical protein
MNAAELIELTLEIGGRVDVQWGLFVTVHMALLGAIVYIDHPLHIIEKTIAFVVYIGFSFINISQMQVQLALLDAAYADVHQLALAENATYIVRRMSEEYLAGRYQVSLYAVYVAHIVMLVLVSFSLVFDQALTKKLK